MKHVKRRKRGYGVWCEHDMEYIQAKWAQQNQIQMLLLLHLFHPKHKPCLLLTDFTSKLERRVSHLPPLVGSSDDDAAFLDWGGRGDHLSDPLILCEEDQSIHNLILIRFQLKFTFFVAIQRDKNNSSRSHSCSSVILLLFRLNQHSTFLSWTHIHCHISKKNMLLVCSSWTKRACYCSSRSRIDACLLQQQAEGVDGCLLFKMKEHSCKKSI